MGTETPPRLGDFELVRELGRGGSQMFLSRLEKDPKFVFFVSCYSAATGR